MTSVRLLAVACLFLCALFAKAQDSAEQQAEKIIQASGVQGGLIVHLGCGDGQLTSALRVNDRFLVHGLDTDAAKVEQARERIRSLGLYGKITVEQLTTNQLPHTDNLVNLIVVSGDSCPVSDAEIQRVLCPGGVAVTIGLKTSELEIVRKPWPSDIDQWTHFLYDATGNAVGKDRVVAPPQHVQWVNGPKWARGHEQLASMSVAVTSHGRVFYIADEGAVASIDLPSQWSLFACDAFNGVTLWKRPIAEWEWTMRPFRSGPPQLHRRMIAIGDLVYVTLGYGTPLTALDGATGEVVKTYEDTDGAEEILHSDGVLYVVIGDPEEQAAAEEAVRRGESVPEVTRRIQAMDPESGQVLWSLAGEDIRKLFSLTLAVCDGKVCFQTYDHVICVEASTGKEIWRTKRLASLKRPAWSVPTLVIHDDVVLSADRESPKAEAEGPKRVDWTVSFGGGNSPPGEMIALSADTGKELWRAPCREGYNSPVDVFVANGLVWSGNLVSARDPGITVARDLKTGEVKFERPNDQEFFTPGMSHHRCYRNKATEQFVLLGRSGVEFLDMDSGKAIPNHWIRGTCQYGIMPANGLLYVPQHTCACYIKTKLNSFNALAPARTSEAEDRRPKTPRLEKGPAFGDSDRPSAAFGLDPPWPTYRHDIARSGATDAPVPAKLKTAWQTDLGGSLTAVTIAEGKVFLADKKANAVFALDQDTGKEAWSYTVGAAVDSPPTIYQGLALFGSADGYVYCLRADNGQLVWRFRAGPEDRRVVVYDSLESAWPVSGAVLVQEDIAYFAAGRSSFLDDGIYLFGVDARTGEKYYQTLLSGRDPQTGEQPKDAIKGFDMPGGLPDVLSGDGTSLYMRDLKFDRQVVQQQEPGLHLFSPTGYLDDSWWHRSYWIWGDHFNAGWGGWWKVGNQLPAGRLMSFNDTTIYGFGRDKYPSGNAGQWRTGEYYRVYAIDKEYQVVQTPVAGRKKGGTKAELQYQWSHRAEVMARALVLAGDTLFTAGPIGDTEKSLDAFAGKQGVRLQAMSTTDGSKLAEYELDSMPVFDSMAAAGGRLYLTTESGRVICWQGE